MANPETRVQKLLETVDVEANGVLPWDPQINDPGVYEDILHGGTLAAGEAYMDGRWDCDQLDELSYRLSGLGSRLLTLAPMTVVRTALPRLMFNQQRLGKAAENASAHYGIGNDLYERMLGPTMAYSCARWFEDDTPDLERRELAFTLNNAQIEKFELIARKLHWQPGMRVLDIGSGWGGLLAYGVKHFGIDATGVTPVAEQAEYSREHHPEVKVHQADWRELDPKEPFDSVVSVGMFEHVGPKNYSRYFKDFRRLLAPGGLSLLHTIGAPRTRLSLDPWIGKYIFPEGHIPSERQIVMTSGTKLAIADFHDIGPNYDPTLMAWNKNFQEAWPDLSEHYDERFKRMWEYYLLMCAGSFRSGMNRLFQFVMTDHETAKDYQPVR